MNLIYKCFKVGITIFLYKKKHIFKLHKLLFYLFILFALVLLILFFKSPSKFQKLFPYFHTYKVKSSSIVSVQRMNREHYLEAVKSMGGDDFNTRLIWQKRPEL